MTLPLRQLASDATPITETRHTLAHTIPATYTLYVYRSLGASHLTMSLQRAVPCCEGGSRRMRWLEHTHHTQGFHIVCQASCYPCIPRGGTGDLQYNRVCPLHQLRTGCAIASPRTTSTSCCIPLSVGLQTEEVVARRWWKCPAQ